MFFFAKDFSAEFEITNIEKALSTLARKGTIRRVYRGMYDYPKYSELLGRQLSPDHEQVALAFAHKFNWRILPSGDTALNLLGLSYLPSPVSRLPASRLPVSLPPVSLSPCLPKSQAVPYKPMSSPECYQIVLRLSL